MGPVIRSLCVRLCCLRRLGGGHETDAAERSHSQTTRRENASTTDFLTALFFAHASVSSEAVRQARVIEAAADAERRIRVVVRETRDTLVRRHQHIRIL